MNIMHSHSMFTSYNYLFLKEIFSIPLVTTYHGRVPKGIKKLSNDKIKKVLDTGDIFLVNTRFAKNELIKMGCNESKIQIIPQGTDLSNFLYIERTIPQDGEITLLTVGRLSLEKDHQTAIRAFAKLAAKRNNISYNIVGDGPERNTLIQLCKQLGVEKKVTFPGIKTGDELKKLYASAHIFILPSINETQGVVLQEAQASGLPVIASNVGGIPDVITNKETGLLFDTGNHDMLCDNIQKLISEPDTYTRLSALGRKDVEEVYDANIICKQQIALYRKLLEII